MQTVTPEQALKLTQLLNTNKTNPPAISSQNCIAFSCRTFVNTFIIENLWKEDLKMLDFYILTVVLIKIKAFSEIMPSINRYRRLGETFCIRLQEYHLEIFRKYKQQAPPNRWLLAAHLCTVESQ